MEFSDPRIEEIRKYVEDILKVRVSHHSLTFYGHCLEDQREPTISN
jgi:Fe2+ or Zn2+ uptake regulation protein